MAQSILFIFSNKVWESLWDQNIGRWNLILGPETFDDIVNCELRQSWLTSLLKTVLSSYRYDWNQYLPVGSDVNLTTVISLYSQNRLCWSHTFLMPISSFLENSFLYNFCIGILDKRQKPSICNLRSKLSEWSKWQLTQP